MKDRYAGSWMTQSIRSGEYLHSNKATLQKLLRVMVLGNLSRGEAGSWRIDSLDGETIKVGHERRAR